MKTNPIAAASRAKGSLAFLKRANMISQRYGITPAKMNHALDLFSEILRRFNCGGSFPLTAIALQRNRESITRYLDRNIEFAVHGYTHIDYSQLTPESLITHLQAAQEIFARAGIAAIGFRAPYLRGSKPLYKAIGEAGFLYTSNQPILWTILDENDFSPSAHAGYRRAVEFYQPWDADQRLSLPRRLDSNLVEIPVSLPDDEILLDRLEGGAKRLIEKAWSRILSKTYEFGELFTIQLHPERIVSCFDGLSFVLTQAKTLEPRVWLARMDEIAEWWQARASTRVEVKMIEEGSWQLDISAPPAITILVRGVEVTAEIHPWADRYQHVLLGCEEGPETKTFIVRVRGYRPFVGVAPNCPPTLVSFLLEQGYIVQSDKEDRDYSIYLDRSSFNPEDERSLLVQLEQTSKPLVRLGLWPNGARSAVCVTGDIDAMTLWDYGLRFFGK